MVSNLLITASTANTTAIIITTTTTTIVIATTTATSIDRPTSYNTTKSIELQRNKIVVEIPSNSIRKEDSRPIIEDAIVSKAINPKKRYKLRNSPAKGTTLEGIGPSSRGKRPCRPIEPLATVQAPYQSPCKTREPKPLTSIRDLPYVLRELVIEGNKVEKAISCPTLKEPNIERYRAIGAKGEAIIPLEKRSKSLKLTSRTEECKLLAVLGSKTYLVYIPSRRVVLKTSIVKFIEDNTVLSQPTDNTALEGELVDLDLDLEGAVSPDPSNLNTEKPISIEIGPSKLEPYESSSNKPIFAPKPIEVIAPNQPITNEPLDNSDLILEGDKMQLDYYKLLAKTSSYILSLLPSNRKLITCRNVLKVKKDAKNRPIKYKSWLVARGFMQVEGLDYTITYASTSIPPTWRILLAIAASNKAIYKLLLKYGYNPSTPNIIKLSKALYRVFYNAKTCHFIVTYIDDCLFIGPNIGYITDLKKRLNKVYAIEDLGPAAYFLGYIEEAVSRFNLADSKPISIPLQPGLWLSRSLNRPTKSHLNAAKNLFKYLNSTKDYSICFSCNGNTVADLGPKLSNSSNITTKLSRDFHSKEGPRPLTTTSTTIVDSRNSKGSSRTSIINSSLVPIGFSDSDFAGDKATSKSTYGYLYKLAGGPISWKTKRATTIALSTLEAETDGLTEAIREVQWIIGLFSELYRPIDYPITLYRDNQGSITVANNPALYARTKYTLLKFRYVREQVKAKIVTIIYLNTKLVVKGLTVYNRVIEEGLLEEAKKQYPIARNRIYLFRIADQAKGKGIAPKRASNPADSGQSSRPLLPIRTLLEDKEDGKDYSKVIEVLKHLNTLKASVEDSVSAIKNISSTLASLTNSSNAAAATTGKTSYSPRFDPFSGTMDLDSPLHPPRKELYLGPAVNSATSNLDPPIDIGSKEGFKDTITSSIVKELSKKAYTIPDNRISNFLENPNISNTHSNSNQAVLLILLRNSLSSSPRAAISRPIESKKKDVYNEFHALTFSTYRKGLSAFNAEFNGYLAKLTIAKIDIDPSLILNHLNIEYLMADILEESRNLATEAYRVAYIANSSNSTPNSNSNPSKKGKNKKKGKKKASYNVEGQNYSAKSAEQASFMLGSYNLAVEEEEEESDSSSNSSSSSDSNTQLAQLLALKGYKKRKDFKGKGLKTSSNNKAKYKDNKPRRRPRDPALYNSWLYDTGSTDYISNSKERLYTLEVLSRKAPPTYTKLVLDNVLYLPNININIVSRVRHYNSGGCLIKETLYRGDRRCIAVLDFKKSGFFLDVKGSSKPILHANFAFPLGLTSYNTTKSIEPQRNKIVVEIPSNSIRKEDYRPIIEDAIVSEAIEPNKRYKLRNSPAKGTTLEGIGPSLRGKRPRRPIEPLATAQAPYQSPRETREPKPLTGTRDLPRVLREPVIEGNKVVEKAISSPTLKEPNIGQRDYYNLLNLAKLWHVRLGHIGLRLLKKTSSITKGLPNFDKIKEADFHCSSCDRGKAVRRVSKALIPDLPRVLDSIEGDTVKIRPRPYNRNPIVLLLVNRKMELVNSTAITNKETTPFQALFDELEPGIPHIPNLERYRAIGAREEAIIPLEKRSKSLKFTSRTEECKLLAVLGSKTYLVYIPSRRAVLKTSTGKFIADNTVLSQPTDNTALKGELVDLDLDLEGAISPDPSNLNTEKPISIEIGPSKLEPYKSSSDKPILAPKPIEVIAPNQPITNEPLNNSNLISEGDKMQLDYYKPLAKTSSYILDERSKWLEAITKEFIQLLELGVFKFLPRSLLPSNRKLITCRNVLKVKKDAKNRPIKYKSRLVARGFMQVEGLDYTVTYASTSIPPTWHILLAIASNKAIYKLLLKYGYNPSTPNIIKLSKALYSLKQSPREWQDKLKILLKSLGYLPLISDPGVFYNAKTCHFIVTYIDDCLFIGPNIGYITDLKKRLNKVYAIEDLGPAAYFLGVQIIRDRPNRRLWLNQSQYVEEAWLSRSLNRPTKSHLNAAKNLFKYLNSTKDYSICFSYNGNTVADLGPKLSNSSNTTTKLSRDFHFKEGPRPLTTTSTTIVDSRNSKGSSRTSIINSSLVPIGFSDSDFAGDKATKAIREVQWIIGLFSELHRPIDYPITLYGDNQGSITVANDLALHARTKHTLLKFRYVREQVKAKIVTIIYLNTKWVFYNAKTRYFVVTYIDNCLFIRPDRGYITDLKKRLNKLSRSLNRPTKSHLNAAKNLFKYLNSTKDYSICFSYNGNTVVDLGPKLSNSSNTTTKLSRDFYSKERPRPLTTTSTTIVDSRNGKGSSWTSIINSSLVPIGFSDSDFTGDKATSKSTYGYLYKLAALHARTKHTVLKFRYVKEQVKAKIVTIIYLNTKSASNKANYKLLLKYGYSPSSSNIIKLSKASYGLKQSPKEWQDKLKILLKSLGYLPLISDPGVFYNAKTCYFIITYIDNYLFIGPHIGYITNLKRRLNKVYTIKDLGPAAHFLGYLNSTKDYSIFFSYSGNTVANLGPKLSNSSNITTKLSRDFHSKKGPRPLTTTSTTIGDSRNVKGLTVYDRVTEEGLLEEAKRQYPIAPRRPCWKWGYRAKKPLPALGHPAAATATKLTTPA
ncbi:hypothetical protein P8C59_009606 [Phyllachora maydis]|uniref:Uncharacterized protein n=1 Tax=Phyllachora maydis TaxID=1825666 RepID=A0AAD9MIQ7_9PEZI|nr:hypothetical protein P8C59_009606 [Phyllachora maydis]